MDLEGLRLKNDGLIINEVAANEFISYGRVLNGYQLTELIQYVETNIEIPLSGNQYFASNLDVGHFPVLQLIRDEVYGQLPIQAGTCAGRNSTLNGLEYHQGSELVIAVTDCIHLVGRVQDIMNKEYDSGRVQAFYQPKGTAVELYSTTLHYAPCKTNDEGYVTIVILPEGTNDPLDKNNLGRNKLLTKKNKFLMVHSSQTEKVAAGAHPGITGENIEVRYK